MSIRRRIASASTAAILTLSSLMSLSFSSVAHAAGATRIWTGIAGDRKFSTANNWQGGAAPQTGDIIQFSTAPNADTTLINDLGFALSGVRMAYTASNYSFTLDTLALTDGATISNLQQTVCQTYPMYVVINNISSTGSISDLTGSINNAHISISGDLTVTHSFINAQNGSNVDGNVIIAAPVDTRLDSCNGGQGGAGGASSGPSISGFTIHGMTVQNGATLQLGNTSYPLTLGGGSGTDAPRISFNGDYDNDYNPLATTYTLSSNITLVSDAQVLVGDLTTVNVTGAISGAGHKLTRDPRSSNTGVININPSSNDSNTQTGNVTNAATETTISDSQPNAYVNVKDKETVILDGTRDSIDISGGGILKGTGTVNSVYVSKDGTIAPGHSPGKLTILQDLTLGGGSIYQAELKTATDGEYDQLVVGTAADTTGNDVKLSNFQGSSTLAVSLYDGFNIKAGDKFTIINNLSQTAVSGTFAGLPEGTNFNVGNGGVFSITYKGGDGNDVVLTAVTAPKAPDTGFALVAAHPMVGLGAGVLAAGALMVVASRTRKLSAAHAKRSRR